MFSSRFSALAVGLTDQTPNKRVRQLVRAAKPISIMPHVAGSGTAAVGASPATVAVPSLITEMKPGPKLLALVSISRIADFVPPATPLA